MLHSKPSARALVACITCICISIGVSRADTEQIAGNEEGRAAAALLQDARVAAALADLKQNDAATFIVQRELAQIPAPPLGEARRAKGFLDRLRALGFDDAALDPEGNVMVERGGCGSGPTLILSAHLDTVFPAGTDLAIRQQGGRFHGPGLADDSRGLAVLLAIARAIEAAGVETVGDIVFFATVGEEGVGNLRGVKALFHQRSDIDGFISVEPGVTRRPRLVNKAIGSHRWEISFRGPGGHSYLDYGAPSAVHAMGRAIARIADLQPPVEPRTTFTVGVVEGGTSVNAIAAEARIAVDIRSEDPRAIAELERRILAAVQEAVEEENSRWESASLSWQKESLGDRPAGATPDDSPIVLAALHAAHALNFESPVLAASSTDSNVPMSIGVPAITVSGGGLAGALHSKNEWFDPTEAWRGAQHVLLTVLALVGVEGVSDPLLAER